MQPFRLKTGSDHGILSNIHLKISTACSQLGMSLFCSRAFDLTCICFSHNKTNNPYLQKHKTCFIWHLSRVTQNE